jgi:hypothetical protein
MKALPAITTPCSGISAMPKAGLSLFRSDPSFFALDLPSRLLTLCGTIARSGQVTV